MQDINSEIQEINEELHHKFTTLWKKAQLQIAYLLKSPKIKTHNCRKKVWKVTTLPFYSTLFIQTKKVRIARYKAINFILLRRANGLP